jgi:TetR/AcrR family transcriptional repressor of nem operon
MRVTREQMAEHRRKILDSAGKLFRAKGFDAVTVAEVMQAAGLTHGGFYGHFKSKDELIAETMAHALKPAESGGDLAAFTKRYLSPRHRDDFAGGCSTAGLSDTIERFSKLAAGKTTAERRRNAIGQWAAMVGAMVLARSSDDLKLSDEILSETRAWLEDR